MTNRKRDLTLDITKGVSIIFMVLGHMHFSDEVFNKYVYSFHMPLFFIVSGILFSEKRTIKEIMKSRARALLVPYISFGGVYGVIYIVKCLLSHDMYSLKNALKVVLIYPTDGFPFESALWFLPVMFLTSTGYAAIRKHFNLKWTTATVLLIGILGFIFPILSNQRLPWGIDSTCVALLFFHTGYMIRHFALTGRIKNERINHPLLFWVFFLSFAGLNIFLVFLNEKVNLRTMHYGNPVLTYLNAVVGTMIWICISDLLTATHKKMQWILCRVSELSIVFVCINHGTIHIFRVLVTKVFTTLGISTGVFDIAAIFILSMVFMLFVGTIIDRTKLRIFLGRRIING